MINTTIGIPHNQIMQSIKIECKKEFCQNTPYFFTTIRDNKNITTTKKIENKEKQIKK